MWLSVALGKPGIIVTGLCLSKSRPSFSQFFTSDLSEDQGVKAWVLHTTTFFLFSNKWSLAVHCLEPGGEKS